MNTTLRRLEVAEKASNWQRRWSSMVCKGFIKSNIRTGTKRKLIAKLEATVRRAVAVVIVGIFLSLFLWEANIHKGNCESFPV